MNLNRMLELLDEQNITNNVGMKHDIARAQYSVIKRTVASFNEFNEEVTRFVQYELRATQGHPTMPTYMASSQGMAIVERAFHGIGGIEGAFEIARTGIRGGLRAVIDALYEYMKRQEEESYIDYVLRTEVDPLSFDDRTALMQAYLNRFRHNFPQGVRVPTALELATHYSDIIRMHTELLNSMRLRLRRA